MKQGWESKEFEDCLDKVVYTEKIQRKDFLEDGEFPVISQEQNFINGYWNDSDAVFKIEKPVVIFGDHTQVLKYVDFDFVLGADGVKILQPIDGIKAKYFFYYLNSVNLKSLGYARHYRLLKEVQVPVPSIPEQQRIVSVLDNAFASIAQVKANAERNLVNARELFDAVLEKVFSKENDASEETTIGEQITLQRGFDITKSEQQDGNIPVVSSGGIKSYHNVAMVKGPGVVIGRKGTLGKSYYVPEDYWPHDTTLWVKDFKGNNPRLVYYLFLHLDVTKLDSGAANPALNRNIVHPISIYWPKKAEQRAIVGRLEALSAETGRLEAVYRQKVAALEELKKSVLAKAFEGSL